MIYCAQCGHWHGNSHRAHSQAPVFNQPEGRPNITQRMIDKGRAWTDEDYNIWRRCVNRAPSTYEPSVFVSMLMFDTAEAAKLADL